MEENEQDELLHELEFFCVADLLLGAINCRTAFALFPLTNWQGRLLLLLSRLGVHGDWNQVDFVGATLANMYYAVHRVTGKLAVVVSSSAIFITQSLAIGTSRPGGEFDIAFQMRLSWTDLGSTRAELVGKTAYHHVSVTSNTVLLVSA